jgi:hypothetical protein
MHNWCANQINNLVPGYTPLSTRLQKTDRESTMAYTEDIAVSIAPFEAALTLLGIALTNVSPSTAEVAEISSQAATMRAYRERLTDIQALLEQYLGLLERDKAALGIALESLIEADQASAAGLLG